MLGIYIKSHIKSLVLWIIICIIFGIVFYLYGLPLTAVLYGAAISGFFAVIFLTADFISFGKKHIRLQKLQNEIIFSVDNLPSAAGIENDYINLVETLFGHLREYENDTHNKFSDMTDYYTLWVHQIKTPIAAMSLILQDNTLQSSDSNNIPELKENLRKIEQYTEMVLVFLRLDSDHTDFVIKEYDLDGIIRQAIRKFSSQFIRKKLKLTYEPIDIKALTDEKWLSFVIEQIISNAVKYTNSGGVEIYLETPVTLCVKDTGIGISSEDLPRVFEKGYTGYNGRACKKASGIGLYLCKRICGKLGHQISAESSDAGTVIKINLEKTCIETE